MFSHILQFPFSAPSLEYWNYFHHSSVTNPRVIFTFQTSLLTLMSDTVCKNLADLLGSLNKVCWTFVSRPSPSWGSIHASSPPYVGVCHCSPHWWFLAKVAKSQLRLSLQHSLPLARQLPWLLEKIHQNCLIQEVTPTTSPSTQRVAHGRPQNVEETSCWSRCATILCNLGAAPNTTTLEAAEGDLTVIAFYYLFQVGEYTC